MEASKTNLPVARRLVGLLIPCGIALLLFGLLAWPGLAADFSNRFILSTKPNNDAASPDIAASGNYVAVVWSEGYNADVDTKEWGRVYIKSAHAVDGWEGRVEVFAATTNVWGREARLAFDPTNPTKVHVVWAQASGCSGSGPSCSWTSIRYTTCNLGTNPDSCVKPSETIVSGLTDASTPDVAIDAGGGVHVVWREGASSIRYCKKGNCGSPAAVGNGQHPSLVFANNRLHVVWDAGSTIEYRRDDTADATWSVNSSRSWSAFATAGFQEPGYPTLAARGSAVYVAWAVRKGTTTEYALAFDFYDGAGWKDVSGQNIGFTVPGNDQDFAATTRYKSDSAVSYAESLKPSIVMTGTGVATQSYAHLAWHGRETGEGSGAYEVWYTYLPGIEAEDWATVGKVDNGSSSDAGDPALAIGSAINETHVAFMQELDGEGAGGVEAEIDVWYVGAYGNRENDLDDKGPFLPIIFKNAS